MGDSITFLLQDSVWLLFKLISMIMFPTLVVGLVIGIFQAATQIQEMTLSFIPKIAVLLLVLYLFGPLMSVMWLQFATSIFQMIIGL